MNILAIEKCREKLTEEEESLGYKLTSLGTIVDKHKLPCIRVLCPQCGKLFLARRRYRKSNSANHVIFCSRECFFNSNRYTPPYHPSGRNHPCYKNGTSISRGYIIYSSGNYKGMPIHRVKAEKVLNRKLKRTEVVHHIDGNKANNRNNNLLICTTNYHTQLHNRMSELYMQEHFGGNYA